MQQVRCRQQVARSPPLKVAGTRLSERSFSLATKGSSREGSENAGIDRSCSLQLRISAATGLIPGLSAQMSHFRTPKEAPPAAQQGSDTDGMVWLVHQTERQVSWTARAHSGRRCAFWVRLVQCQLDC